MCKAKQTGLGKVYGEIPFRAIEAATPRQRLVPRSSESGDHARSPGGCRRETEMWPRTAQGVPPHTARRVCLGFAIRKHPIKTFVLIKINKRGPHPGMSCLSCVAPHRVGGSHAPRRSSPAETPSAGPSPGSRRGSGGPPARRGPPPRPPPGESSMASGAPPRV